MEDQILGNDEDSLATVDETAAELTIPVRPINLYVKHCGVYFEGEDEAEHKSRKKAKDFDPSLLNLIWKKENEFIRVSIETSSNLSSRDYYDEDDDVDDDDDFTIKTKGSASLPATLKLLRRIQSRILGESNPSVPRIVTVRNNISSKMRSSLGSNSLKENAEVKESNLTDFAYLDLVPFAKKFVDDIIQTAKKETQLDGRYKFPKVSFCEHKPNIFWPTIEEFNQSVGEKSIQKYIHRTFILVENWKYKVSFMETHSDIISDFYVYDAKFALPTKSYPVPQVTASIYFTIEVSRVIPKDQMVGVTFTIEGLRGVMKPGEVDVKEDMLLRVLYCKLAVIREVTF